MAGLMICCGFFYIIAIVYLIATIGMYMVGNYTVSSLTSSIINGLLYFFGFVFYISLYINAMKEMHNTALDILKKKEENKLIYREERLKSNTRVIISILIKHLLFLGITITAAAYFDAWYIKLPLLFYICSMLGYVACYPLSEESTSFLVDNMFYKVESELILKTSINTILFVFMTGAYYYYA
jgi:hypothetical protein